jgi:hypothetical protein
MEEIACKGTVHKTETKLSTIFKKIQQRMMWCVLHTIPQIYVALEDYQVDHQFVVTEVKGKIAKQVVSILIDLGSTHSYVTSRIVDNCSLKRSKHSKSWLVQIATGTKRKVIEIVTSCAL